MALLFCGLAAAARRRHAPRSRRATATAFPGTITKMDEAASTFVVKTAAGKETVLARTAATKVNGAAPEGGRPRGGALARARRQEGRDLDPGRAAGRGLRDADGVPRLLDALAARPPGCSGTPREPRMAPWHKGSGAISRARRCCWCSAWVSASGFCAAFPGATLLGLCRPHRASACACATKASSCPDGTGCSSTPDCRCCCRCSFASCPTAPRRRRASRPPSVTGLTPLLPFLLWRPILTFRWRMAAGLALALWPGQIFFSGVVAQDNWVLCRSSRSPAWPCASCASPARTDTRLPPDFCSPRPTAIRQEMLVVMLLPALAACGPWPARRARRRARRSDWRPPPRSRCCCWPRSGMPRPGASR